MSPTAHYAVIPRDSLFCKDGRDWFTSASERGHALEWPWPSTILGALRTAWGRNEEQKTGVLFDANAWRERTAPIVLGTTLVLRRGIGLSWSAADCVWPTPADAVSFAAREDVYRLRPFPPITPTIGRDDDPAREAMWRPEIKEDMKPLSAPRWWSHERFVDWLIGSAVQVEDPKNTFVLQRRVQVHVGISPATFAADDGKLYSHDVVETLERDAEWAVGAELELPSEQPLTVATLGSDRRLAQLEPLPPGVFALPERLFKAFQGTSLGLRLILVTPACFGNGWLPDGFRRIDGEYRGGLSGIDGELVLRAAMVGRPVHISGWDMVDRKPKPTSRMVPAGSVYFFERTDGKPFGETEARSLWLKALGVRTNEGFGRIVPAIWDITEKG